MTHDYEYEPDAEDSVLMIKQKEELASERARYRHVKGELRDYHVHTDRQLHELSKERKWIRRKHRLWATHDDIRDVFNGSPEVKIADGGEAAQPLTRKDKRRGRKTLRKVKRNFENLGEHAGEKSPLSPVVGKTGALIPVVAA